LGAALQDEGENISVYGGASEGEGQYGLSAYQKCVTETVRRFGGLVAKYMGDGVFGYFGYSKAQ
jgi:class 3 adenylate cyclase